MIPIRQMSVRRPFDNQLLGFLSSLVYFGQLWWDSPADAGLPVCKKNDRQDETVSKFYVKDKWCYLGSPEATASGFRRNKRLRLPGLKPLSNRYLST